VPDPSNPTPPESGTPRPAVHHDTVLLTDHGSASPPGTKSEGISPEGPNSTGHSVLITNISPAALAALGQRYDIVAEAGHGSMGNVYKARDRETGEIVALKLLKPEIASDQVMIERFKNELLFARRITHKNVCRVYDFNRIAGIAYTSMEFVDGESLRSVLTRFGGLPARKAIDISLQICSGLKEAHAQGIVHRDLKPENVMVDSQGNVKIMDFGIARSMDTSTRLTGTTVGTPAYMAPEQVAGKPVDYRTDIYSLGLVLYEIFTGVPAFHADTSVAVALKQMNEAPPPPHTIDPAVPLPIERAVLRCLEKEPAKRFSSIGELIDALSPSAPINANLAMTPLASYAAARGPSASPVSPHGSAVASAPMTNPFYSPLKAPPEPRRHGSIVGRFFLLLILAAGAYGAQKWAIEAKQADFLPAPALPTALIPVPPDFALTLGGSAAKSAEATSANSSVSPPAPSDAAPPTSESTTSNSDAPNASAPAPSDSSTTSPITSSPVTAAPASATNQPRPEPSLPKKAAPAEKSNVPSDIQQRADKAFKESSDSVAAFHAGTYLWVGRYEKKDRAQKAAKRIEDLGLPALVVPRHGLTDDFFIVLSGPFDSKRVSSVSEWLEEQGFSQVREFKWPPAKSGANP
jgi:serine/threonine protein kinase